MRYAVFQEQGVTFALVEVKSYVVNNYYAGQRAIAALTERFNGAPVVLFAPSADGRGTYFGREDLVAFLRMLPVHTLPWRSREPQTL